MQKTNKKIVAILLLSSLLLTSSMFIQSAHAQGLAWIEPPVIYTNVCQEFTVTVVADVEFPIVMFEFWLYFDPTQMQVINAIAIPPWMLTGFTVGPSVVWVQGIYPPSTGPGLVPLADITFHCIASGTSDLSFDMVLVQDPGGGVWSLPWKGATVTQYDLYWKPLGLKDYAPSGIPDFDQKQDAWTNPITDKWSYCGPTAIANSFWWLDSFNEPNPIPPPTINDNFPLVWSYNLGVWDDHDPLNVGPLINDLAWYMDTDGTRTGTAHNGTDVMDMARGIDQYLLDHGLSDKFYQKTIPAPDFEFIEHELEKCEDVTLLLGFWQTADGANYWRVGGHYVTVAGVDSEGFLIAFSDPCIDNAEAGGLGVVRPAAHGYPHPTSVHNDTLFASHDIYAALVPGPGGSPGNPNFEVSYNQYEVVEWYELINNMAGQNCPEKFEGQTGDYDPMLPVFTEVEYAVIVSPWYAKPPQPDYAPSGVPDFDQRQNGIKYEWTNPYPPVGTWSFCGPTAVANSLWWLDSEFEPDPVPPPVINDGYPLVESYSPDVWDDHDPQNVPYLIEHLAYLMNTDNLQGIPGLEHCGTSPIEMQRGIDYYLEEKGLSWKFYEHTEKAPDFYWIEEQVEKCEDVILLLGFWQWQEIEPGYWDWRRMGGHYVTVAGVDSTDMYLAISDPFRDAAEFGGIIPGRVLPLGHGSEDHTGPPETLHNNASYVSHDIYTVWLSPSPGGIWGLEDYYADEEGFIDNFDSCQNFPDEFWEWEGNYDPIFGPVYTEIEYAIIVSCETGKVAAGSEDGNVYVHDFYGNLLWKWFEEAYCVSVAFDNEANYLAGGWRYADYGCVAFFDANAVTDGSWNIPLWYDYSIAVSESYHHPYGVYDSHGNESMSVDTKYNSYNEFYIVAAAHDYGLNLYDQWGTLIWQYFDEEGPETIVRISQDGNYIVCADGYNSGTLHYFSHLTDGKPGWGPNDGIPVWSFGGYEEENAVQWTAISGLGDYVAVSGWEMSIGMDIVILLNRTGGTVWRHIGVGGEGSHLTKVDMPCHGRSVVAATEDLFDWFGCDLYYFSDGGDGWDSGDGTPVWDYWPGSEGGYPHDPDDDFYTVSISQNGDVISAGGYDGVSNLYVLDKSGSVINIISDGTTLQSVDVTFNGQYTALGTGEGMIALYDKDTGNWIGPWGPFGPIRSVAISKIYPCMFPYPDHDLAVTDVTPDKISVAPGEIVKVNVTVTNEGAFAESFFDVFLEVIQQEDTFLWKGDEVYATTIPNLPPGDSVTVTFEWDTTGWPETNYLLVGKVSIVYDEIEVYDNTHVDGIVEVAGVHDVAVTDVETFITVCAHIYHPFDIIFENYTVSINATIENQGDFGETFDVTLKYDSTLIQTIYDLYLDAHTSTNVTFTWDTHGVTKGTYTITVEAVLPTDADPGDNTKPYGPVKVTWLGDMDGDFDVDEDDLWYFCAAFIDYYKIHVKDPLCDLDRDCDIDEDDLWGFCAGFIAYWKAP